MKNRLKAPKCPQCMSQKVWKDGTRKTAYGDVQRYLCRDCGLRFSESRKNRLKKLDVARQLTSPSDSMDKLTKPRIGSRDVSTKKTLNEHSLPGCEDVRSQDEPHIPTVGKGLYFFHSNNRNRQIGANQKEAKNLPTRKTLERVWMEPAQTKKSAGDSEAKDIQSIQGKIVEYLWYLKKRGLRKSTIEHYGYKLRQLSKRGFDLSKPEEVKTLLATNRKWSERTKAIFVGVYDGFAKFLDIPWDPPKYTAVRKLPFIPTEAEIDQFISACGKRLATFLQLLKETGARCGEASQLEWIDCDFERRFVKITPEKGSDPRILPISLKLVEMLKNMPKTSSPRVFAARLGSIKANMQSSRKRVARKLASPRMLKTSFHTFRHWKGTMEYHRTKDIIHVQKVLGHREIKSTMIYINLEHALFQHTNDKFHVKTAETVDEACKLVEVGFEYVSTMDGVQIFRKRK